MPARAKKKTRSSSLRSLVGTDVLTRTGQWLGIVEGVFRSAGRTSKACVVVNRPHGPSHPFALPVSTLKRDPIQDCLVWNS